MIINPIVLGSGLKPQIVVTAPTGSTVTCTTPSGVVLTATEAGGTWMFANLPSLGTYTVTATLGSSSRTQSVTVDKVGRFAVTISFMVTITISGSFSKTYGYVTIDGTKYTSATTITVPEGTVIHISVSSNGSSHQNDCEVTLNNQTVQIGSGTYDHTANTNCTIEMTKHVSGFNSYYTAAITV